MEHGASHERGRRLETLLNQLQGNGPKIGAAAGLARLRTERLQSIHRNARARSQDCAQGLEHVTRLLAMALAHPDAAHQVTTLRGSAEHLASLAGDLACWLELAENADFYAQRRDVAGTVAALWAKSSHALGELPSARNQGAGHRVA